MSSIEARRESCIPEDRGVKTAQVDIDLVERRLKIAQQDYEARYGKAKR